MPTAPMLCETQEVAKEAMGEAEKSISAFRQKASGGACSAGTSLAEAALGPAAALSTREGMCRTSSSGGMQQSDRSQQRLLESINQIFSYFAFGGLRH